MMNNQFKNIFNTTYFFLLTSYFNKVANMDASHPWQTGFQDPATPIMEGIIFFNGLLMSFMILISCLVGWLLYKSLSLFNESVHKNPVGFTHSTLLEVVWTIIPAVILMIISVPSYNLLYAMDEVIDPSLTIKVVGHQWYWSYECSDFDVSPKDQKESRELLDFGQKVLNLWVGIVKDANLRNGVSEDQIQTSLAQGLLNDLDKDLKELPRELSEKEADILANRLNIISMLLCKNGGFGGSDGKTEILTENSIKDIVSSVKSMLDKYDNLIDDQKDSVINILKTFKEYLKINEDNQTGDVNKKLMTSLLIVKLVNDAKELPFDKIEDNLPLIYGLEDVQGSDSHKNFDKDDDDSNGDEGSLIAGLLNASDPAWCELETLEDINDLDYYNLKMSLGNLFNIDRRSINAAYLEPEPGDENKSIQELFDEYVQTLKKFKKAVRVEDLSESKLMDIDLMDDKMYITRLKRDFYSSQSAYEEALSVLSLTQNEFDVVLEELNAAKLYSHLCNIDLAASNVNKLTAEYYQAEAATLSADPKFIRSAWINHHGYHSWHIPLKLAAKTLSEEDRMAFIRADGKLSKANCLLGRAQKDLTQEEVIRSNAIADNALSKFMAMEREIISVVEEYKRGKFIVEEAEAELKSYQEIADKADVRLNKAKKAFDKVNNVLNRDKAILRGSEKVFKNAQLKIESPNLVSEITENNLDLAENNFIELKKDFNKALSDVSDAKSDLKVCKKRLKYCNKNLVKTEKAVENTGLLRTHEMRGGEYLIYYPNYIWEMRQEDIAFIKDQWETDSSYVQSFEMSLDKAKKQLSKKAGDLLESELNKTRILIENLTLDNSDNLALERAKNHLNGIKLDIAKAIHNKALVYSNNNSNNSQIILNVVEKALYEANLKDVNGYSGSVISNKIEGIDSDKLMLDYAESCLDSFKAEIESAEAYYEKATTTLKYAENLLIGASKTLSKEEYSEDPRAVILKTLYEKTLLSLRNRFEHLNTIRLEVSPLDVKLDPRLLQSKSYEEVLLADAELVNVKFFCAVIAQTLNIFLPDNIKPFNVEFSYLKDNDNASVNLVNTNIGDNSIKNENGDDILGGGDDSSDGKNPDKPLDIQLEEMFSRIINTLFTCSEDAEMGVDKTPKSASEIKKIISQIPDRSFGNTSSELLKKIIYSYADLLKSMSKKDSFLLLGLLNQAFDSMIKDQVAQNQLIEDQISLVKQELGEWKQKEIDNERINFDSYLIAEEDLIIPEVLGTGKAGKVFRLLEVDNRLFVPTNTHIRLLVTSADVLHSWAVPSLGVKVDACPGRLNQVFLFVKREGVFYGQCSELCGVNHGFMPIVVQAVSQDDYLTWVGKRLCS